MPLLSIHKQVTFNHNYVHTFDSWHKKNEYGVLQKLDTGINES